jgi:SAM-dependent methyltransferase
MRVHVRRRSAVVTMADPGFRRDLYAGTARYYDQFRPPYPQALIDDLAARSGADGSGLLLDLACGTGHVTFALQDRFAEVWAVDQEPDMISVASQKASAAGIGKIRFQASSVTGLRVPAESVDLVTVGNAFHRLDRVAVAADIFRWLAPGRFLALLWGGAPEHSDAPWVPVLAAVTDRWRDRAGNRIPAGYERARQERPDLDIVRAAGFQVVGRHEFATGWEWTIDSLLGYVYSLSTLSRTALGDLVPGFEADLRRELRDYVTDGRLRQTLSFAYELGSRPA